MKAGVKAGVRFDSVHVIELACYVFSDDVCSDGGPAYHLGSEVVTKEKIKINSYEKKRAFKRIPVDQYGLRGHIDANIRRSSCFM